MSFMQGHQWRWSQGGLNNMHVQPPPPFRLQCSAASNVTNTSPSAPTASAASNGSPRACVCSKSYTYSPRNCFQHSGRRAYARSNPLCNSRRSSGYRSVVSSRPRRGSSRWRKTTANWRMERKNAELRRRIEEERERMLVWSRGLGIWRRRVAAWRCSLDGGAHHGWL